MPDSTRKGELRDGSRIEDGAVYGNEIRVWFWYSVKLDAWLRLCGEPNPERTTRCMRPWGHDKEHESASGATWVTDTTDTTDNGKG